jgi:hypothetical protein
VLDNVEKRFKTGDDDDDLCDLRVLQSTSIIEVTATLLTRLSLVQRFFAVHVRGNACYQDRKC